jgi:hypothetical protein
MADSVKEVVSDSLASMLSFGGAPAPFVHLMTRRYQVASRPQSHLVGKRGEICAKMPNPAVRINA